MAIYRRAEKLHLKYGNEDTLENFREAEKTVDLLRANEVEVSKHLSNVLRRNLDKYPESQRFAVEDEAWEDFVISLAEAR